MMHHLRHQRIGLGAEVAEVAQAMILEILGSLTLLG